MASGGSNAGPTNPDYLKTVGDRVKTLRDSGVSGQIPADLVQASASGLDPHITPESARLQVPRVAKARGVSEERLLKAVSQRNRRAPVRLSGSTAGECACVEPEIG